MTSGVFLSIYLVAIFLFLIRESVKHKERQRNFGIKIRAIRYAEKYRMLKRLTRGYQHD